MYNDLWNIGEDSHVWKHKTGKKNKYNEEEYDAPVTIQATKYGSEVYKRGTEELVEGYNFVYQTTANITKGDKIDDRIVIEVTPCNNIFGEFEFNVCYVS